MKESSLFSQALGWYTRLFAVWVILFGILAYFFPQPLQIDKKYNLWFFAMTMFGIGAVLRPADFKEIARRPLIVAIGSVAQFTIMPAGAFLLARTLGLPAELAGAILPVPFWAMFMSIVWTVVVPLWAGFAVRIFFQDAVEKVKEIFPAISVTFIIFICSYVIAGNRDRILNLSIAAVTAVALLNVWGMAAGYGTGKLFKLPVRQRRTLSIEIGMQNAGMGTALVIEHFGNEAAIPTALFVFVCIITASIMVEIWKERRSGTQ